MFGYVRLSPGGLSPEELERYKGFYCGLCRALKMRHGALSRLTLTYDMSFLVILLGSLYEPEEERGAEHCPRHPFSDKAYIMTEISDYAADMNIALAYLNCRDDWKDDLSLTALCEAGLMKSSYLQIKTKYPRQCGLIESCLRELAELEERFIPEPDRASRSFGRIMAELFVYKEDRWADTLRDFGMALGQFIYVMDACIDLREDKRNYKYNPFVELFNKPYEKEQFEDILKMLMGSCVYSFDRLPLVQDIGILRNILCLGVWEKFNKHYNINKDKGAVPDGTGPL